MSQWARISAAACILMNLPLGIGGSAAAEAAPAAEVYLSVSQSDAPLPESALGEIRSSLSDAQEGVRASAARTLGGLGPRAASAAPALGAALQDRSASVRAAAAEALGKVGDRASISVLRKALKDKSASVRARAAWSLGRLGAPYALV